MDKAADFGSEDCRFESYRSHKILQIFNNKNIVKLTFIKEKI